MGWWITRLRRLVEHWAGDVPWRLRLGGALLTLVLVSASGASGWTIERLAAVPGPWGWLGTVALLLGLASALAGRSLALAVRAVLAALPSEAPGLPPGAAALEPARQRLAWIVGRDTRELSAAEILRAAAETASENAVDGLFAPLFWMLLGVALAAGDRGHGWGALPGPLALAWGFKAASTLDSMLGYRRGRLAWLGTAGARLDDLLVWLPCRLVVLSLPLVRGWPWRAPVLTPARWWALVLASLRDGAADPSPNAGVSQAAYAHGVGMRLGGRNRYPAGWVDKPLVGVGAPPADGAAVERILTLSRRLSLLWLASAGGVALVWDGLRRAAAGA